VKEPIRQIIRALTNFRNRASAATLIVQPLLWWLLVASLGADLWRQWHYADNHKYLIAYWILACTLSLLHGQPQVALQWTARVLVTLVFLFATLAKLAGGQYLDGSFLYVTFITDSRVQPVGALFAGASFDDFRLTGQAID
jgi:hypothetical protein